MNSLFFSLLPAIGVIFIGCVARNIKIFDDHHVKSFEIFLFKIAFPCFLFYITFSSELKTIFNIRFIFAYLATWFFTFLLAMLLHKNSIFKQRFALSFASSYSNTTLYSVPITFFLFGNSVSAIIANLVQVMIIQSIMIAILTFFNNNEAQKKNVFLQVIKTPLVFMPFLGLFLNYWQLHSFKNNFLYESIKILGNAGTSMSLFIFGLNCTAIKFNDKLQKIKVIKMVVIKNLIHPLFALCVGYFLFHLTDYWLKSLIIIASAPTAFLIYVLTNQYQANDEAIKIAIIISCFTSIITVTLLSLVF